MIQYSRVYIREIFALPRFDELAAVTVEPRPLRASDLESVGDDPRAPCPALASRRTKDWNEGALAASNAEGLRQKLGTVGASHECRGLVSPFFSRKFGLNPG